MTEDRKPTTASHTTNAPKAISRPARIAAVTVTTALLMTTTAMGIAAVTQAINANDSAITSAEAATSAPAQLVPTMTSAVTLPDLSKKPALPSIQKILKSKSKQGSTVAAPQTAVAPAVDTSTSSAQESTSAAPQSQGEHESEGEHENDD
jgi:hypothetical protein